MSKYYSIAVVRGQAASRGCSQLGECLLGDRAV